MLLNRRLSSTTKQPISFIGSMYGSTLSGGVTSVTFTGHLTGDLLIAMGGSQQTADPSFTGGWTKACSYYSPANSVRVAIIVYKFATSSSNDTVTFTGTGTSSGTYSGGQIFRNVSSIGNTTTKTNYSGNAVSSIAVPTLTLSVTNGSSAVVVANYIAAANSISACTGCSIGNGLAYELGAASFTGRTATVTTVQSIIGAVELVN